LLKKLLLSIAVLIVVLIAAFFALGFIFPSVEYTTTIEIDKPRDVTWQVIRERKDWIYGFKSYEQLAGAPNEVGSRARINVVRDGREMYFDSELLDIKPPESATTRLTNDMLVHEATVHLTENNGRTELVSNERITGANAFFRSLFTIFRGQIIATSQKNFAGLKQAVEATP
jgi:hypothetical protein